MQFAHEFIDEKISLKKRSDLHLSRKILHIIGIAFIVGIFQFLNREQALLISAGLCVVFIPIDFFRSKSRGINSLFLRAFGKIMRSNERYSLTGTSYLFMGLFILVALFPKDVASLSLAMLAVGDPMASIFGVMYGKDKLIGNKSFQGTLAAFVSCSILAFFFFLYFNLMIERLLLVAILAGVIGAISELIPVGKIDDNLSFPVMASLLLYILFHIFGGF